MADREELERRAAETAKEGYLRWYHGSDPLEDSDAYVGRAVLDALGLTEETVWTDNGDKDVQRNTPDLELTGEGSAERMQQAEELFEEWGWVKKRRWITEWEVVE